MRRAADGQRTGNTNGAEQATTRQAVKAIKDYSWYSTPGVLPSDPARAAVLGPPILAAHARKATTDEKSSN
jgi:hypothetical protein